MRLVLSESEQRRFAETSRVLFSPLDQPVGPWRADVLHHLGRLLDSPMGGFILPTHEPPPYTLYNLPDTFAQDYFDRVQAIDRALPLAQQTESGIWSTRSLVESTGASIEEGWFGSREYRDFYSHYGIQEGMGFVVPAPDPPLTDPDGGTAGVPVEAVGAVLTVFTDTYGTAAFGERGVAKLRMLLPALEAGVAGRVRFGWMRETLHDALDLVQDGLEVRDAAGRLLHVNHALARLRQDDPESRCVDDAIERVHRAMCGVLQAPAAGDPLGALQPASIEVRTAGARYRVRGQLISAGAFGQRRAIVVSVSQLTPRPPSLEELQERWGLSQQESRVALLLANGYSNARLAAELNLGTSTARHYTEAVFLKLQVHSRAEAVRRILLD
jgi:DNA-binding CsgD family transcriptional regulator